MAETTETKVEDAADGKIRNMDKYVYDAYKNQIDYYWRKASYNKKSYKNFRFLTIFLGALVTLVASLTTSSIIASNEWVRGVFTIGTPVIAAALTIINSLSQNFQWGATWRDMSMSGQRLEKELDRFLATPVEKRNYRRELEVMNDIVLQETHSFFQRVLNSEMTPSDTPPTETN